MTFGERQASGRRRTVRHRQANTATRCDQLAATALEACRAMGLGESRLFFMLKLPGVLPSLLEGLREMEDLMDEMKDMMDDFKERRKK